MILVLSFDVRRRGGIERLSLQVQASLERQGERVQLLCPQRLGPGRLGRQLGRLRFLLLLAWRLPQASQVLSMHALLLRPLRWLTPLRRQGQSLQCWLHGIEVWGAALAGVQVDVRRCDGLIASSRFTRAQVLAHPGAWPGIAVVHPMADLIDPHQRPEPLPYHLTLLTVARLEASERYKGHRLVLAALAMLQLEGVLPPGLQWRVVGDGNDRAALEAEAIQLGMAPWVRFLGSVSDQELAEELRHCSLLLMPSAYGISPDGRTCGEGFGIVYLEAAQAGRASIACREGGQTDLIVDGQTGWLIEPQAGVLAQLIRQFACDPTNLKASGERARQRALKDFSQTRFDQALAEALSTPATA